MADFNFELTRRRVLASILVIGLAAAAAGVGTFALFNSESTADTNEIAAGEMTLTVDDGFSTDGLYPTQTTGNQSVNLTYSDGPNANLNVDDVSTANGGSLDWASNLSVENAYIEVDGVTEKTYTTSSLSELAQDDVASLDSGDNIEFIVDLKLDQNAGNEFQNESVDINVTFNATQPTP